MTTDTASLLMQAAHYALDYMETIDERPVVPDAKTVDALQAFHEALPDMPCDPGDVIDMLHRLGSPATTATTGGRYFGFVIGGCLPAPLAANWLAGAWDQNAGAHTLSPIAAELESVAQAWLLDLLRLPRRSAVSFVSGATMASFACLAAARTRLLERQGWDVSERGLNGAPPIRIVAGEEIHPSVIKALSMLGFGRKSIEWVPCAEQGQIRAGAVPRLDPQTLLLLQCGNVNSGASDPFTDILPTARAAGAWTHIDGAFGLWARVCPSLRGQSEGADLADSWAVDAHKWLNVPYDSAMAICRDPRALHDAFAIDAPYIVRGQAREPSHMTPELSRRARGVEVWAALKSLGRAGLSDLIERNCAHARSFAEELSAAGFDILNDVVLNQVVLRYRNPQATRAVLDAVQREGTCWLGPTVWQEREAMRISVSSWATTDEDVAASVAAFITAARRFG